MRMMLALTGRMGGFSAARFSGMPAAVLPERNPAPKVLEQFADLLPKWHGLIKIG